jgi:rare lipoprotein A
MRAGGMTAAHRSLPFGTRVRVTNNHTGRSVVVRITDRGPFVKGRVIDLSPAAASAIGVSGVSPGSLHVGG